MIHRYKIGDDKGDKGGKGGKGDWGVIGKEDEVCEKRLWGDINSTICISYVLVDELQKCIINSIIVAIIATI